MNAECDLQLNKLLTDLDITMIIEWVVKEVEQEDVDAEKAADSIVNDLWPKFICYDIF